MDSWQVYPLHITHTRTHVHTHHSTPPHMQSCIYAWKIIEPMPSYCILAVKNTLRTRVLKEHGEDSPKIIFFPFCSFFPSLSTPSHFFIILKPDWLIQWETKMVAWRPGCWILCWAFIKPGGDVSNCFKLQPFLNKLVSIMIFLYQQRI